MSQENLEIPRRLIDAYNRGDIPSFLEPLDPEVEWIPIMAALEGRVYRGREDVRRWFEDIARDWEYSSRATRSTVTSATKSLSSAAGVLAVAPAGSSWRTSRPRGSTRSRAARPSGCGPSQTEARPSKPWGCRSKTLTPTPEACGILRGRCRRRTWRSCGGGATLGPGRTSLISRPASTMRSRSISRTLKARSVASTEDATTSSTLAGPMAARAARTRFNCVSSFSVSRSPQAV
jgi:ketosteroid isomerase-like protein